MWKLPRWLTQPQRTSGDGVPDPCTGHSVLQHGYSESVRCFRQPSAGDAFSPCHVGAFRSALRVALKEIVEHQVNQSVEIAALVAEDVAVPLFTRKEVGVRFAQFQAQWCNCWMRDALRRHRRGRRNNDEESQRATREPGYNWASCRRRHKLWRELHWHLEPLATFAALTDPQKRPPQPREPLSQRIAMYFCVFAEV